MATRFTAISRGELGTSYTLVIDDSAFGGSNTDIEIQGFQLTYDPDEQDDPITSIISSSCQFNIVINDTTRSAINTLIDDMVGADEGRFRVKITKGGNIWWLGYILTDQISIEDQDWADKVSTFTINAVDGISRLKDLDYNDAGTAYSGRVTAREHLFNILDKIGTADFYGASDDYLFIICRWYENSMGAVVTDNPLSKTYIDHLAFISTDSEGNETFVSCYDVLKELCQLFLCRFYYSNGVYRYDQISEYREATVTRIKYYKSDVFNTSTTGEDLGIVENSDDIIRLGNVNGRKFYFAPSREIILNYKHVNDRNYLAGQTWTGATAAATISNVGRDGIRLWVRGTLSHTATFTPSSDFEDCIFIFEFNITCTAGGTTYYLQRDYSFSTLGVLTYTEPAWTTTNTDRYHLITDTVNTYNAVAFLSPVNFETPNFPGSGEFATLTFDVAVQGVYTLNVNAAPGLSAAANSFLFHNVIVQLNADDESALTQTAVFNKENADAPNASLVLEYDALIGDSPSSAFFTSSSLTIDNGGTEEVSQTWAKGVGGGGKQIQKLWLDEVMKLRTKSLARYEGQIRGTDYNPHNLYELIDGSKWVMQRLTYDSILETWSGDWWFTGYDDTLTGTLGPIVNEPGPTGIDPSEPPPGPVGGVKKYNPKAGISAPAGPGGIEGNGGHVANLLSAKVDGGVSTTTLSIAQTGVDGLINAGDTITVYDPLTGNTHEFTVADDVAATDTSITVSSTTPAGDLSAGSFVILDTGEWVENIRRDRYSQTFVSTGVQALTVTANSGNLPSNTAQIEVYYGATRIFETDDWTVSGSVITLVWKPETGVKIRVFFWYP